MSAFGNFVAELRADPRLADIADTDAAFFREVELEGVHNWHARQFLKASNWIVSQPRSLDEKVNGF